MGWSLTIGRIAGTSIRLHFTFLLFLAWIAVAGYLANGPAAALATVVFILLVFGCVTLHEFGHIMMARRFGVSTPEVILSPIGGIANMERMPEKPQQELLVAIAGPLVNVAIAAILMLVTGFGLQHFAGLDFNTAGLTERLILVNITLVLFNIIPAFPMDGGRVLRAILAMNMEAAKATAVAARIGQGFAFLFVLLGLFHSPILMLVGVFIYFAASAEERQAAFTGFASKLTVGDAMEASPVTLPGDAPLSRAIDMLLSSPQRDFPVVDDDGRVIGMLDREAMLVGLRDHGGAIEIAKVMRQSQALAPGQALADAFTAMQQRRTGAEVVTDAAGRVSGLLTLENITEMMLVENAQPGFRFKRH